MDVALLKAVVMHDAHMSPHGEAQARLTQALNDFIDALPESSLRGTLRPTWKTINDRFKKLVQDHREASQANRAASGIIEVRGEREVLLDDIVLAIDEFEEHRRAERNERTELDRRLQNAGADIRDRASSRASSAVNDRDDDATPGSGRKRRRSELDEGDEAIVAYAEAQKEVETQRIKLDFDRLEMEKKRVEALEQNQGREMDIAERRCNLDERRIQLEERRLHMEQEQRMQLSKERDAGIEERKQLAAVLEALVKKLN